MKKSAHLLAIILLACIPYLTYGQSDESKYLAGVVPEVEGKVVFSRSYDLPGASQDAIFDRAHSWLEGRMKANANISRIVYSEKDKGTIAALSEEYIVFKSSALSLDRALTNYQVTVTCKSNHCLIEMEKIRYTYQDEKYSAEEYITDKVALNKNKTGIYRGYQKFRIKTVDLANELFNDAHKAFGLPEAAPVVAVAPVQQTPLVPLTTAQPVYTETPTVEPVTPVAIAAPIAVPAETSASPLQGYRQISPDKIPGNIIKMLNEDWMLITAGNDQKFNMMTASWGGLGVLFGKATATCFINPARYTYQLMEKGDTYTFTFYTEAYREALKYCGNTSGKNTDKVKGSGLTPITTPSGSKAFAEAWLIIECRKLVSQSLTPEAISNEKVKEEWSGKQLNKMFIGEIINVWVK